MESALAGIVWNVEDCSLGPVGPNWPASIMIAVGVAPC